MFDVVLVYIFNAKIVDDESEGDIMGFMTEETFGVLGFDLGMFCEIGDEVVVSNFVRLLKAVPSSFDLCVNVSIN